MKQKFPYKPNKVATCLGNSVFILFDENDAFV